MTRRLTIQLTREQADLYAIKMLFLIHTGIRRKKLRLKAKLGGTINHPKLYIGTDNGSHLTPTQLHTISRILQEHGIQ